MVMLVETPPGTALERSAPHSSRATSIRWPARCHDASVSSPLLDRARRGDEQAFRELTRPYLRELRLHCYRMLGSLVDSDDLLQETLVAAWRGLDGFAGRSSFRAWLYRIATNRCLNAIRDGKRRPPAEPVPPFSPPDPSRRGELTWLQPYPDAWLDQLSDAALQPAAKYDAHTSVELAFITALQRIPPRQTAAVVLADVLGFSAAEVASMLESTPTAVKGLLQRARAALAQHHTTDRHAPDGGPGSAVERDLASRFAAAFTAGDINRMVDLLTDDVWLAMPPATHEYVGREAVAAFVRTSTAWRGRRCLSLVPTRANGQPAFACSLEGPNETIADVAGILVLTMSRDRISGITRFLDIDLQREFEKARATTSP